MKEKNIHTIDRKEYLFIIILIIWCIFAFKMVALQFKGALKSFPKIYFLNLEQKYRLIDGNFYSFLKFCEAKIPERASIIFKILPKEPEFRSQEWLMTEYFIGKSPYYLYPRRIFRENDANPKIKYKIIYDLRSKTFSLYYQ